MKTRAVFCALALLSAAAHAQSSDLPPALTRGFALLRADSMDAATRVWSVTWIGPADSGKAETILASLQTMREAGGRFRGYDLVKTEVVSPHLKHFYILMLYDRMPLYAHFVVYNSSDAAPDWHVSTVGWHTEVAKIWPASIGVY